MTKSHGKFTQRGRQSHTKGRQRNVRVDD